MNEWDYHDLFITRRDVYHREIAEHWLHGEGAFSYAHFELQELATTPYQGKPARHIRKEKTRDYRKRRPQKQRYASHVIAPAAIVLCLLGVHS